ncbi:RNB-domain-containing protein [Pseudovirgaria hyperparasitica]|uniref:RNB-domain-containing protein n=1 Tax=Pseudovirgaria hyperparasitica TaxID=470096 RepID=A0A6A6W032_9PEZI|nr:RNB-domain-containing protein [Pseudovirgaria hyperparasitica]KAF2755344.1 RNB-domain-containing protein [Pseudovirgaria hyperparasitica]
MLSPSSEFPRFCWACVSRTVVSTTAGLQKSAYRSRRLLQSRAITTSPERGRRPTRLRKYNSSSTIPKSQPALAFSQSTSLAQSTHDQSTHNPKGPPPQGIRDQLKLWQEQNGTPNAEECLENLIPALGDANAAAQLGMEEEAADERDGYMAINYDPDEVEDIYGSGLSLASKVQPGDLCMLPNKIRSPANDLVAAIYVSPGDTGHGKFLNSKGAIIDCYLGSILLRYPAFVSQDEVMKVKSCMTIMNQSSVDAPNTHYLDVQKKDTSHVSLTVCAPMLEALSAFRQRYLDIYREHHRRLDFAYELLAHPTEDKIWSLDKAIKYLLEEHADNSFEQLSAVHLALERAGSGIDYSYSTFNMTQQYYVKAQANLTEIETVISWIRNYKTWRASQASGNKSQLAPPGVSIIERFVTKAKGLVSHSRSVRSPSNITFGAVPILGGLGPSKLRQTANKPLPVERGVVKATFDSNERLIIRALRSYAVERSTYAKQDIAALLPTLMHEVGRYDGHNIGVATVFLFLQEIGVLTTYEDHHNFTPSLMLPGYGYSNLIDSASASASHPEMHEKDLVDTMADLRKDWEQLPVYCIDDASASEIDDGISVEVIEGGATAQWWLHVHVANPTAFIPRNHILARLAGHLIQTVYSGSHSVPLLPKWVTQGWFSLQSNRPVLTFSGRIDSSGTILESKVQPGIIRNVILTTRHAVDETLGGHPSIFPNKWTVGGALPEIKVTRPLQTKFSPSQVKDLQALWNVAEALDKATQNQSKQFQRSTFVNCDLYSINVSSSTGQPLPNSSTQPDRAIFSQGDPVIEMRSRPWSTQYAPIGDGDKGHVAKAIVETSMVAACTIGARWARDRNVPLYFRGTHPYADQEKFQRFVKNVWEPSLDENGIPPLHVSVKSTDFIGRTYISTTPVFHVGLNADAYTHVTSPLRRYADMIAHWQIESALRAEARAGKSLAQMPAAVTGLAYSQETLESGLVRVAARIKQISMLNGGYGKFWKRELVRRALHFNECPEFPRIVTCMVMTNLITVQKIQVSVREFELHASMMDPRCDISRTVYPNVDQVRPQAGDIWECEIARVEQYSGLITLTPIRLIEKWKPAREGFNGDEFFSDS